MNNNIILIPLIHGFFISVWFYFNKISKTIKKRFKLNIKDYIYVKWIGYDKTIFIPLLIWFFATAWYPKSGFEGLLYYKILFLSLTGPIAEEFAFRSLLIGNIGFLVNNLIQEIKFFNKYFKKAFSIFWVPFIIISTSILFILNHGRGFNDLILIINTIIYTSLYLINKKNLLPSILIHIFNNLFLSLL
ncbi:MAG: CPBP family intramembrane glutamic endopeptidase [Candidatus Nanoarchaeia archaeon]|jgi:membrane protease YdiL (CAAX protease family)